MSSFLQRLAALDQMAISNAMRTHRKSEAIQNSANLVIDIGGSTQSTVSITTPPLSGVQGALSGAIVGAGVNLINADTFCNLHVTGVPAFTSGELRIGVQCADSDTSGSYTDPTSGLAQLPTYFASGGILYLNSGGTGGGVLGAATSGQNIQSGFDVFAGFQRTGTFVRAIMFGSGSYAGSITAGFVSQLHTTGSGGGFTMSPGSGSVSV